MQIGGHDHPGAQMKWPLEKVLAEPLFAELRRVPKNDVQCLLPNVTRVGKPRPGFGAFGMTARRLLSPLFAMAFCLGTAVGRQGQASPPASTPGSVAALAHVFPVVMQQTIVPGKIPPGTRVRASLVVATLLNGKVVPRNAVFSGEVIESQAKTANIPSRLSIRLDSAQWKNESTTIQVYLTSWFSPVTLDAGPNLQYGPEQPASKTWNGMGQYPDPNSAAYKPFPSAADADKAPPPDTSASVISKHAVAMKNVESQRNSAGGITLVSNRSNLKLDKVTTYIFASDDVPSTAKN